MTVSVRSGATDGALQLNGADKVVLKSTGAELDATPSVGDNSLKVATTEFVKKSTLTSSTSQATTSGTTKDFTGIPATAKRITIAFSGLSLSSTGLPIIQLGTASGFETTGYFGAVWGSNTSNVAHTTGFLIYPVGNAAYLLDGIMTLVLLDASTNTWVMSLAAGNRSVAASHGGGTKVLAGVLSQIRLASTGADTLDSGAINIMWE